MQIGAQREGARHLAHVALSNTGSARIDRTLVVIFLKTPSDSPIVPQNLRGVSEGLKPIPLPFYIHLAANMESAETGTLYQNRKAAFLSMLRFAQSQTLEFSLRESLRDSVKLAFYLDERINDN